MLERREYLGNGVEGRVYRIDEKDERIIENHGANDKDIDYYLDEFEEGMNVLNEIDGELFEVMEKPFAIIKRKAYL